MLCFRVNQNYSLINETVEHDENAEPEADNHDQQAKKRKKDKRKKLEKQ